MTEHCLPALKPLWSHLPGILRHLAPSSQLVVRMETYMCGIALRVPCHKVLIVLRQGSKGRFRNWLGQQMDNGLRQLMTISMRPFSCGKYEAFLPCRQINQSIGKGACLVAIGC